MSSIQIPPRSAFGTFVGAGPFPLPFVPSDGLPLPIYPVGHASSTGAYRAEEGFRISLVAAPHTGGTNLLFSSTPSSQHLDRSARSALWKSHPHMRIAISLAHLREGRRRLLSLKEYARIPLIYQIRIARSVMFGEDMPTDLRLGRCTDRKFWGQKLMGVEVTGLGRISVLTEPRSEEVVNLFEALNHVILQLHQHGVPKLEREIWASWAILEGDPHRPPFRGPICEGWLERHQVGRRALYAPVSLADRTSLEELIATRNAQKR